MFCNRNIEKTPLSKNLIPSYHFLFIKLMHLMYNLRRTLPNTRIYVQKERHDVPVVDLFQA